MYGVYVSPTAQLFLFSRDRVAVCLALEDGLDRNITSMGHHYDVHHEVKYFSISNPFVQ